MKRPGEPKARRLAHPTVAQAKIQAAMDGFAATYGNDAALYFTIDDGGRHIVGVVLDAVAWPTQGQATERKGDAIPEGVRGDRPTDEVDV